MAESNAFRLVWRSLAAHPVYRRPATFQVFVHLLLHAAWKDHVRKEGEHSVRVRRGQVITTRRRLHHQLQRGKFTAAARSRIQRELDWLQSHGMIRKTTICCGVGDPEPLDEPGTSPGTPPGTRAMKISICNFARYQDPANLPRTMTRNMTRNTLKKTEKKTEKKKTPAGAGGPGGKVTKGESTGPRTPAARLFERYAQAFQTKTREPFPRNAIRRDLVILNRLLRRFDEGKLERLVDARFSGNHPRITQFHDEAGHWGLPAFERFMVDGLAVELNGHYRSASSFWARKEAIERRAQDRDREQAAKAERARKRPATEATGLSGALGGVLDRIGRGG